MAGPDNKLLCIIRVRKQMQVRSRRTCTIALGASGVVAYRANSYAMPGKAGLPERAQNPTLQEANSVRCSSLFQATLVMFTAG